MYLEFLDKCLSEKYTHSVVKSHLIKTFVITGMGIIESVFYLALKQSDQFAKTEWSEAAGFISNPKTFSGDELKAETIVYKKLKAPKEIDMNLDSMIKKVQSKQVFGTNHVLYSEINGLRRLRNKIHLHVIEKSYDHDFNSFGQAEIKLMKRNLLLILSSDLFKGAYQTADKMFPFLV